jgi:peroxiredoxin
VTPSEAPANVRSITRRAITWALCAGVAAVAATVLVGAWITRDEPEHEFSVVLSTPGIFTEPTVPGASGGNPDTTGRPLPATVFEDGSGAERALSEFRGTPLVINNWYSACPPCARELADFAAVDAELRADGRAIQFVGVNPYDNAERMTEFAAERGVAYELWRDTARTFGVELGIVAYPVTVFVDADGQIVRQVGEIDAAGLRAAIDELFPA